MEYNNIIDFNDKINLLYDYIYNSNNNICYDINKLKLGNIDIDDIKLTIDENDDFYNKNLENILNGKFQFLNYNENNNIITFKRYSDTFPLYFIINFYKTEDDILNINSNINNECIISYILSELILLNKTKHIILPIINIDVNYNKLNKIFYDDYYVNKIQNKLLNNEYIDVCCLQLKEYFYKKINLLDYIKENTCNIKILLFQLIHTLAAINDTYNGFQHNNLLLENILLYLKKKNNNYIEYNGFKNDKFYIPNDSFDIKLSNFYYSYIPKFYGNKRDESDLKTFINDLEKNININDICDKSTIKFIQYILKENNINYVKLLYNTYFDDYRKKNTEDEIIYNSKENSYLFGRKITTKTKKFNSRLKSKKFIKNDTKLQNKIYNIIMKRIIKKDNINDIKLKRNEQFQESIQQIGGGDTDAVKIKGDQNNPFATNEEKKIYKDRQTDKPPKEPPVLVDQKIYDTTAFSMQKYKSPPPSYIPLYDQSGMAISPTYPFQIVKDIQNQPIQKIYNISLASPLGNYTTLNRVYEDVLPGEQMAYTSLTLFERTKLINFIRRIMLEINDGEEATITGGNNSLLSYIKLMNINPYSTKPNPVSDLPRNFLLYTAAYPVQFDQQTNMLNVNKQAMGLNIRMYMMSFGDLYCQKLNSNISQEDFDLWRELKYYDIIRNNIINKNVSPNFILPILYKIDSQSNINWDNLENIKTKDYGKSVQNILIDNQKKINTKYTNPHKLLQSLILNQPVNTTNTNINSLNNINDLTLNCGKTLILLTEAPTNTLVNWASVKYEFNGTIRRMISTGYHPPHVWKAILFQLVYACAVLQESSIYIENFSLHDNVYIKDINSDPNAIGSWIYKIDNIEYYIPNYGYILMIDSKFSDLNIKENIIKNNTNTTDKLFKIYCKEFTNNSIHNNSDFDKLILDQFKNIINPDNFSRSLVILKGSSPDMATLALLRSMHNSSYTNIREYIHNYFSDFLHNRIGTMVTMDEYKNINFNMNYIKTFIRGSLMVYERKYKEYEWVMYCDDSGNFKKKVITKINDKYQQIEVHIANLYNYPEDEIVYQDSKKNFRYDDNYIYETYNLDNL